MKRRIITIITNEIEHIVLCELDASTYHSHTQPHTQEFIYSFTLTPFLLAHVFSIFAPLSSTLSRSQSLFNSLAHSSQSSHPSRVDVWLFYFFSCFDLHFCLDRFWSMWRFRRHIAYVRLFKHTHSRTDTDTVTHAMIYRPREAFVVVRPTVPICLCMYCVVLLHIGVCVCVFVCLCADDVLLCGAPKSIERKGIKAAFVEWCDCVVVHVFVA